MGSDLAAAEAKLNMHTVMVITGGFLLLGVFLIAARTMASNSATTGKAAGLFIPVWLVASIVNMMVGVLRAGYSVAAEAPILLVVFGAPAAVAWLIRKRSPA
jgi:hypothetical protein